MRGTSQEAAKGAHRPPGQNVKGCTANELKPGGSEPSAEMLMMNHEDLVSIKMQSKYIFKQEESE